MSITWSKELLEVMSEINMINPFKYLTLPINNTDEENDLLIAEFEKDNPDYRFASARSAQGKPTVISYLHKPIMKD